LTKIKKYVIINYNQKRKKVKNMIYRINGIIDFEVEVDSEEELQSAIEEALPEEINSVLDWERIDEEED
jgi:hypothetical protein